MTDQHEQLRAKYRVRFLETAQDRVERALRLVETGAVEHAAELATEFRSLAGEAQMLGLDNLAAVANAGRDAAKLWEEEGSTSAISVCEHSLHTIADTIAMLAQLNTGDFTRQAQAVVAATFDDSDD